MKLSVRLRWAASSVKRKLVLLRMLRVWSLRELKAIISLYIVLMDIDCRLKVTRTRIRRLRRRKRKKRRKKPSLTSKLLMALVCVSVLPDLRMSSVVVMIDALVLVVVVRMRELPELTSRAIRLSLSCKFDWVLDSKRFFLLFVY